jgi:formate hydrogenlyase subunit 3/multisubunit Na+/H+ antiporter MnhD subunit
MTLLDGLVLLALLTALVPLIGVRLKMIGWVTAVLFAGQMLLLILMGQLGYGGGEISSSFKLIIFGQQLGWRFDGLSWFFALITIGAALASSVYAAGEWAEKYRSEGGNPGLLQLALAVNVLAMLILLASGDLLSLFIGWELVSWASFLLMAMAGGVAFQWAMRYITYATGGAMAILAGMGLVFQITGSLQYADFMTVAGQLSTAQIVVLTLLFGGGFAVKMGLLPFHLWQAVAYAETPGPGTAFLGSISSRMGLYAIVVVLVQLIGLARIVEIDIPFTFLSLRDLFMWVAAITIILPTFTALRQNDARRLLAWHGVGQGGYMLLGIFSATAMGSSGGLMHVFNHATYQAALFFSVYAVVHRTGTSDLNKLGGLVSRMPLSFLVMLVGIIGLAGIPPMNGFVSKWLVYRALLTEGMPLLFVASVIGTLGTILSVYKLIHNMFLGQLRVEHTEIKEAPWSMMIPMLLLSAIVFITGFMPGLALDWVASAQAAVGLPVLQHTLGGVELPQGGLDMIWLVAVLFAGFGVGALLFYSTGKAQHVNQLDNYAGGHFLSADVRYHYSDHFYSGLMHRIGGWYRESFRWMESVLVSFTGFVAQGANGFYRIVQPALLMLVVVVLALWVVR